MSNWESKEGLTNAQVSYGALDVLERLTPSVRLTHYVCDNLLKCLHRHGHGMVE